jgi:excisionase family DNA binding protein
MQTVVDVRGAAEYLLVSPQTVIRLAKKGHIGRKVGKLWRFTLTGLERYVDGEGASDEAGNSRKGQNR